MQSLVGRQAWLKWSGVSWALLAGCLLAPSLARAQCGHYVLIGGSTSQSHSADNPRLPTTKPLTGDATPLLPMSRHMPCSGPGCKRGPSNLPIAPVAPAPVLEKEWGHL